MILSQDTGMIVSTSLIKMITNCLNWGQIIFSFAIDIMDEGLS